MELKHWNTQQDGPLTEESMRRKLEECGYHVTRYIYPPGVCFPLHTHDVDKIEGILAGSFRMSMQGQSVVLKAGDMLEAPRNVPHEAQVVGDEAVISLDAVKWI